MVNLDDCKGVKFVVEFFLKCGYWDVVMVGYVFYVVEVIEVLCQCEVGYMDVMKVVGFECNVCIYCFLQLGED